MQRRHDSAGNPTMTTPPCGLLFVPCFNEEAASQPSSPIFRKALPSAEILSTTTIPRIAPSRLRADAGAQVRSERRQARARGSAHVRRHRRRYLCVVDGDATYDAASAPA